METVLRTFLCRFAKPEEFQVSAGGTGERKDEAWKRIVSRSSGYSQVV